MNNIAIVGAGLAGSLLSIYLARRGFEVDVYEARSDMRRDDVAAGRSINLALSDRGIAALRKVGMAEHILSEAVPMHGRMIHSPDGGQKLLRYSGRPGEHINSISRAGLNIALINAAEKHGEVRYHFDHTCLDLNIENGSVAFANGHVATGETVIATDGAGSAIRQAIERQVEAFEASSVFLDHGYKELHIPPASDGGFLLEKNALHIWPRHQFMMIALPNFDGSFTCTLFLARQGEKSFEQLTNADGVDRFFEGEFPDALPLMPTLVEDFFANPTGELGTLKCWPWNVSGRVLLLGDAAHAMVPFYGQGMNCAFEDVRVLDQLIGSRGPSETTIDWEHVFAEFAASRKPDADAICDMAQENFYEMRDATADPVFQRKREIETKLEQTYPDYFSKYSMVTFREDMPYSMAKALGNAQDELLMEICSNVNSASELNMDSVMTKIRSLNNEI